MATIRILLGIICLVAFGRGDELGGGFLTDSGQHTTRNKILEIARSQIGVRETTGNNDGAQIEAFLHVTNLPIGNPWCAAFVSWVFEQAGLPRPRTAWSPALFPLTRQTLSPKPADVLGIYSLKLKRIAHCGIGRAKAK